MARADDKEKPKVGRRPVPEDEKKERCTFSISRGIKDLFFNACDESCADPNRVVEALMLDYCESQGDSRALEEKLKDKEAELRRLEGELAALGAKLTMIKQAEEVSAARLQNQLYVAELVGIALRIRHNPSLSAGIPDMARKLALRYGYLARDVARDINVVVSGKLTQMDKKFFGLSGT